MCFSATVSFGTAALLAPIGLYALRQAWTADRRYLPLAAFPLLFALQQAAEGLLWLYIGAHDASLIRTAALGFLLFVYVVWPTLVPLAAAGIETSSTLRKTFLGASLVGLATGSSIYLPLISHIDWMSVSVAQHSISYALHQPWLDPVDDWSSRAIYALFAAGPLLLSSVPGVRRFGALIVLALLLAALMYDYAFPSVWCFFAAVLSAYVMQIVRQAAAQARNGLPSPATLASVETLP